MEGLERSPRGKWDPRTAAPPALAPLIWLWFKEGMHLLLRVKYRNLQLGLGNSSARGTLARLISKWLPLVCLADTHFNTVDHARKCADAFTRRSHQVSTAMVSACCPKDGDKWLVTVENILMIGLISIILKCRSNISEKSTELFPTPNTYLPLHSINLTLWICIKLESITNVQHYRYEIEKPRYVAEEQRHV